MHVKERFEQSEVTTPQRSDNTLTPKSHQKNEPAKVMLIFPFVVAVRYSVITRITSKVEGCTSIQLMVETDRRKKRHGHASGQLWRARLSQEELHLLLEMMRKTRVLVRF